MIYPTIFSSTTQEAQFKLDSIFQAGIDRAQVDVADGQLIDALLLTPADVAYLDTHQIKLDFHFMTEEPLDYVYETLDQLDNLSVRALIGQIERMSNQKDFVENVKQNDLLAGLSLDIYTPVEELDFSLLSQLDIIQVMGGSMGKEGQALNQVSLDKLESLKATRQKGGFSYKLMVDIGVSLETINDLKKAGADDFAVGSQLWRADNFQYMYQQLMEQIS